MRCRKIPVRLRLPKAKSPRKRFHKKPLTFLFLIPSLIGVLLFFVLPFGMVIYYSLVNRPVGGEFVRLDNFKALLDNKAFLLGAKNTGILLAVSVPLAVLLRVVPRTVPYEQCSEVYKKYAEVEGVRASFVKDFWLNDSVAVDVVLLEATDSAGWVRMQKGLGIVPRPPEVEAVSDTNAIDTWLASKDDYTKGKDSVKQNNDLIAVSYYKRKVSVFILESEEQEDAIVTYQLNNTIKNI